LNIKTQDIIKGKRIYIVLNRVLAKNKCLPKKTIYGRCPKCKTKSALVVVSGNPGKEKFKCNECYSSFGMDDF
jgi:transposase-like protein